MSTFAIQSICSPVNNKHWTKKLEKIAKNVQSIYRAESSLILHAMLCMHLLSGEVEGKRGKESKFKKANWNLRNCPVG